jgi:hypothetical protein
MKRTIVVSDLNGEEVQEGASATVTVTFPGEDTARVLEITRAEADDLFGQAGREVKRRGRKAGDAAATPEPAAAAAAAPAAGKSK